MNDYAVTKGTTIGYGDVGVDDLPPAGPFNNLAGIKEIPTLPAPEDGEIDITRIDQEGRMRQIVSNQTADPGTLEVTFGCSKTMLTTLYSLQGVNKGFEVSFSDGAFYRSNGFIKKVGRAAEVGGEILVPVIIRFSGEYEFAEA